MENYQIVYYYLQIDVLSLLYVVLLTTICRSIKQKMIIKIEFGCMYTLDVYVYCSFQFMFSI